MLEYHIDYEHDVIRHLIIQEKRKIRYQQIMNFTRNLYHHCQYRRSRQSSNQTSNHLPLASIQGTSLSTQLSSMLPFLRPQSWLACVLLFWIFIFLSLISYCPVVSELSSPSTSSKVNEVINSDHQLSRIAYVNNGPSLTDIINSILAKERSLNNSLIQHQQVMVPSTTISPVTTESITESSRIPLEDSSTSIVPSTNKKHFVDPQTSLDCHRREYTFKASRTDAFGRKCWQYVKVMSCWGRCDSGEVSCNFLFLTRSLTF